MSGNPLQVILWAMLVGFGFAIGSGIASWLIGLAAKAGR